MNKLTITIVSFNSSAIIQSCLKELLLAEKFRTIIVDNASTDGSSEVLKACFPKIEIVSLQHNIGYGRAANVGLRQTQTPYALLLNPDLVVSVEGVEQLLGYVDTSDGDAAIWGPATAPGQVCDVSPQSVDWVSGCAMLFDMKKIRELGFFDENIFLFFEESDLCYRATMAGYKILLCEGVSFNHLVGKASSPDGTLSYLKKLALWLVTRLLLFETQSCCPEKKTPAKSLEVPPEVLDGYEPAKTSGLPCSSRWLTCFSPG